MDRFDRGAALEHQIFVLRVFNAELNRGIANVDPTRWSFVTAEVWIVVPIILPIEVIGIDLAHLGGNSARIRATADDEWHEQVWGVPLDVPAHHRVDRRRPGSGALLPRHHEAVLDRSASMSDNGRHAGSTPPGREIHG